MRKHDKTILVYETKPEIGLIFSDYFIKHDYVLKISTNIEQINFLAEQLKPILIIINSFELSNFTPSTKINNIPILLPRPQIEIVALKDFQKITFFNKPINSTNFQKTILTILDNITNDKESDNDFDRNWLEVKLNNGYNFHYIGSINQNEFHRIFERIKELITVGRDHFTLNLTEAIHIENITPSSFYKLHSVITNSHCSLKIIMNASELAEALSHEGIDIDQYIKRINY